MNRVFGALLLVMMLALSLPLIAQPKRAFKGGEELRYVAEYKVGMFNVDIAVIDFTVKEENRSGRPSYKVNAVAQVLEQYRYFFDMRDDYYVWLDRTTLKPIFFENFIKEGSYTLESNYVYDWTNMRVKTYENRPVWESPKRREFELSNNSYDGLSLFYNLRSIPLEKIRIGVADTLNVVFANKVRRIAYRFIGRENKKIKGVGYFKTLKFKCQLADGSGVSFKDGSEFTLWLSDDDNRIPLYIETPIRVGSVRGRLVDYKGLVAPLNKI
ncbi:MAG: DUF3108 domain-containing protein [Rikenellaceae bacterium]